MRSTSLLVTLLVALVIVGAACANADVSVPEAVAGEVTVLDSRQGRSLIDEDPKVLIIDVRTVPEYIKGHIVGAQNIDASNAKAWAFRVAELDRERPTIVYCRDVDCSREAAQRLVDAGLEQVYDIGPPDSWDPDYLPINMRGERPRRLPQ